MGLCTTMERRILNRIFGDDTSWTQPTGTFIGLSRSIPLDNLNSLDEPTIGTYNYSRVALTTTSPTQWSIPEQTGGALGGYVLYNTADIDFPEVTGSEWGTITHFVVWDHPTTGVTNNALTWGELSTSKIIGVGDTPHFYSGSLLIRMCSLGAAAQSGILAYMFNYRDPFANSAYDTLYVGLASGSVSGDGSNLTTVELDGGNYSRVAVTNDSNNWYPATSGTAPFIKYNKTAIDFGYASTDWGLVTHFFVATGSGDSNLVAHGSITPPKNVYTDETVVFGVSGLRITVD